ncbi:HupE/UreJ family protein [Cloacibacterium sp. TD35]|uniref:HupE/UreJ family protein n=1 Tax=Cloacibacterium sp. TD35 TaxID=2976818 RepID=UPI00237EDBEC|nr:HupE/UreJ family protein [Cloacibacterium sp. TD35]WDT68371.1 HupE/UreJ family protein [Cloacibacterium sp. TD35]
MQDFLFYLQLGWEHIISKDALDHQLFILALIAIFSFRDWKKVLILVTAFTIGHSLTLVLSALDVFRFPSDWVEFLIPCTIVFTALDNIIFSKNEKKLIQLNYYLALLFGLIHGMGFANSVRMMLASEQDITLPLFGFNVGLELGQIVVVAIALFIHYIFSEILKLSNKIWIYIISVPIFIFALKMALERVP